MLSYSCISTDIINSGDKMTKDRLDIFELDLGAVFKIQNFEKSYQTQFISQA